MIFYANVGAAHGLLGHVIVEIDGQMVVKLEHYYSPWEVERAISRFKDVS